MPGSRVRVELPAGEDRSYEVIVGSGLLEGAAEHTAAWLQPAGWALISDTTVAELYSAVTQASFARSGTPVRTFTFPAGEAAKSRQTVGALQDAIIESGFGRDAAVVALGGGVVGDLAGFVAATLYRGLPFVQLPSTLLAMVDSSVGGKTGIDTAAGKNLVGAFHQPAGVIADVELLASLPDSELGAGLAEVIKYGVILDAQLFVDLEDGLLESCRGRVAGALENVVERSVQLKAGVVADDEREAGRRTILNFGHTLGHGVEAASGLSVSHGKAVAIGMVAEARLACRLLRAPADLPERIESLCARAGLPTALPAGMAAQDVVAATRHDKKSRKGVTRCALPLALGEMAAADGAWAIDVGPEDLVRALER